MDSNFYSFSPELRLESRKKLRIQEGEVVLIYTGRLCTQKNILRLIKEFSDLTQITDCKIRLLLVGKFEDGERMFRISESQLGTYYDQYIKALKNLPENVREKIHFLGPQEAQKLKELYHAADIFISLSLYHDEDYGMAPAEALCCGLPVLLTDWGGFSGFYFESDSELSRSCHLIHVQLKQSGLTISREDLQRSALMLIHQRMSDPQRARASIEHHRRISIQASSETLAKIYSQPLFRFRGFSNLMSQHSRQIKRGFSYPGGPRRGTIYEKVYRAYLPLIAPRRTTPQQ